MLLPYENELLLDINSIDNPNQLYIFAKGVPVEQVLTNTFRTYAALDTNIVIVLSATATEEQYYIEHVKDHGKIVSISTEFSAKDRKDLYWHGGVFFVTSRILVVDFLKEVMPADKITGIIVLRAHNVIDSSQEAFILRLYRSKNKTGFIKAFSQNPTSFLLGYSKVNRIMRCTFLGNVSLWPRFHASIKDSLSVVNEEKDDNSASDVIEIDVNLSDEMREIQSSLLDLVTWSLSELRRLVPALNDEEITTETALTKGFDKMVAAYVDPVWNTINSKTKEILNDLKVFRLLLTHLTKSDCVTFYSVLCDYTTKDAALKSSWLLTKSAEIVILSARKRIFASSLSSNNESKKGKKNEERAAFYPEVHPKWLALRVILREIAMKKEKLEKAEKEKEGIEPERFGARIKTLIFTEDVRSGWILRDFLCHGGEMTLVKLLRKSDNIKIELPPDLLEKLHKINKERRDLAGKSGKLGDGDDEDVDANRTTEIQVTLTQIERKYTAIDFLQTPIFIRPIKFMEEREAFGVTQSLNRLEPDVVILFDPCLELVRNVEVYRARMAEIQKKVTVYFISFKTSVEEQVFLTSIQRERLAFGKLIEEKATMVVPEEREAKDELNQDLWRDPRKANETVSTSGLSRRNQEAEQNVQHVILVDMREFRSELPSLIHKRGIDLEPLTLDVGDYILTPDICVERKSISDLIGSLNSGRLWKQAEAMTRHYKKPIVLIEHEQQAQSVKAGYKYRNELAQIMPKLQILTMNFPKLKIVWSPGAHYTSEMFHELKRGKEQPDPAVALSILKEGTGIKLSTYDPIPHTFLSRMPGIDSRNIYKIMNRCDSLAELGKVSEEELGKILENSKTAKGLYEGFHKNHLVEHSDSGEGGSKSKTSTANAPGASKPGTSRFRVGVRERGRRNRK